ncbi:hypothetical protein H1D32_15165 [Anaerobacillus sp. CMMVII]|uniref:YpoC family protein n=1 Tax=Anaerobacillus sp. CMMVII TaxID=2755588 RepID=UPI0021B72C15|nr:hypothetical protein [Anaerobacillus sp. CMMVII]MCT8138935.1 hypothetical protein [Anaerobacillus sp. CMMVII]
MKKIRIPEAFVLAPFFYEHEEIQFNQGAEFIDMINDEPLIFDVLHYLSEDHLKPWLDKNVYIPQLLEDWQKTEPLIINFFQVRDRKGALEPMTRMVKLFLAFLFWTNNQPVPNLKNLIASINELKVKPVNSEERIGYILSAPNHHHAYTQLKQLFIEQQKNMQL